MGAREFDEWLDDRSRALPEASLELGVAQVRQVLADLVVRVGPDHSAQTSLYMDDVRVNGYTRSVSNRCIRQGVAEVAAYKVNVSLPEELVGEIDETADALGLTRSGFIAEASARYVADVKNLSAEERRREDIGRAIASMRRIGAKLPAGAVDEMIAQTRRDRDRGWHGEGER